MLTAILVILLAVFAETQVGRAYCMSEFHRNFEGLGTSDARINPLERLVFSLMLSQTNPETKPPARRQPPTGQ